MQDRRFVLGVPPPPGPPSAPLGARGARPYWWPTNGRTGSWVDEILRIPGTKLEVRNHTPGIACAFDAAWAVAKLLDQPAPVMPSSMELPGIEIYRALGLHEKLREYQKVDVQFLAQRAYAILAEPMRAGKTIMTLGADVAIGSRKTLILSPSIALWNWAKEVQNFTGQRALILSGLGAREGRLFCLECRGRAVLPDGTDCSVCIAENNQAYGYDLFQVPLLEPELLGEAAAQYCRVGGRFVCTRHPEVEVYQPYVLCPRCREELFAAILRARYVILNYELLVPQVHREAGKIVGLRGDLLGWVDVLKCFQFDVAVCDEAHLLRGWSTATDRKGLTRRERTREVLHGIPRAWALTGTPFWGYTRDIWGILDVVSDGLFDEGNKYVPGRGFMMRYCEGHKGTYGWEAHGRSIYADTELVQRLSHLMIKRSRAELFGAGLPKKIRRVHSIEVEGHHFGGSNDFARFSTEVDKAVQQLSKVKQDAALDVVLQDLAEGNKVIAFLFHRASAQRFYKLVEKAITAKANKRRMEQVNAKTWFVTGDKPASKKARDEMAEAFREHMGAAVFVATIGAMQVGLSLKGASAIHFIDLNRIPGALFQAEDRAYSHDIPGLAIIYYVARGTVDDRIEEAVLPRIEMLAKLADDETANDLAAALGSVQMAEETLQEMWARHTKHLRT